MLIAVMLAPLTFALFNAMTCGYHFHPEALAASLILPAWSVWMLLAYRTRSERVVAWVAFAVSVVWMGFSVMANGSMLI